MVQQRFRANKLARVVRLNYLQLKKVVLLVEEKYLANNLAVKQYNEYKALKRATIIIQRRFRANCLKTQQRYKYLKYRDVVITIQRRFRANKSAKICRSNYLELKNAASVIQTQYRATKLMQYERTNYLLLKKITILIQQRYRAKKLTLAQRSSYLALKQAVIRIEEKYIANKLSDEKSKEYKILRHAAIIVQRRFRANRLMKVERQQYVHCREVITSIQRRYRVTRLTIRARARYLELKKAAIFIQRQFRANKSMNIARTNFLNLTNVVVIVQRRFRSNKIARVYRSEYLKLKHAVKIIENRYQARNLGRKERYRYFKIKMSVILIQKWWRSVKSKEKTLRSIIIVQAFVRGFIARKLFEKEHLPILIEQKKKRRIEKKAVVKIQSCWRGYRTRSSEEPELAQIRARLKIANKNAVPQETIGHKQKEALAVLANENTSLQQIIRALEDLDYVTRRCRQSCTQMSLILPEDLYNIVTSSGRSLPEMQSCTAAASILINFCKYSLTTETCWHPQYMDAIFTVMTHFCDKEYPLFLHLSTLIWLLAHNPSRQKTLRNIPNLQQKLCKMFQLCKRKQKMALKVPPKGNTMFSSYKNLPLPALTPDWGLDYKHRPRLFSNSVHAMQCILDILDMH